MAYSNCKARIFKVELLRNLFTFAPAAPRPQWHALEITVPFDKILHHLGARLNLGQIEADAYGRYALRHGSVTLCLHHDAALARFTANARLGAIEPNDVQMLETLLAASLYGDGCGRSAIGVDLVGQAYLHACFKCEDIDMLRLLDTLEHMADHARYWQRRLGGEFDDPHALPIQSEAALATT